MFQELSSRLSRLTAEQQQLARLTERLRESSIRLDEAEQQKAGVERENRQLQTVGNDRELGVNSRLMSVERKPFLTTAFLSCDRISLW